MSDKKKNERQLAVQTTQDAPGQRLEGLPPVVSSSSRVLILGSFPSVTSLEKVHYYGNPKNHFWSLLATIFCSEPPSPADQNARAEWLTSHGLASWDVIASCIRPGSLDQNIRDIKMNDIAGFLSEWPRIQRIVLNGGTAARIFTRTILPTLESQWHMAGTQDTAGPHLIFKLPSTSPVPSRSFRRMEDKIPAWQNALAQPLH